MDKPAVILASGSKARFSLLKNAGVDFVVKTSSFDEEALKVKLRAENKSPAETALVLASGKALAVSQENKGALVIGADQIVVCHQQQRDKPPTLAEALQTLKTLRGKTHTLVTATLLMQNEKILWQHVSCPLLKMRSFSDEFLQDYLQSEGDSLLSSAGAYKIEGKGIQLFEAVEGEYEAVLGLSLLPLLEALRKNGALPF